MPSPWNAIPHVSIIYKHDGMGRICIFLPCMEQVHRSIAVLKTHGFKDIRTFECLLRPADIGDTLTIDFRDRISTIKKMSINIISLKGVCYNKNDE
jgi:tRNA A58 N-methylase Trm61